MLESGIKTVFMELSVLVPVSSVPADNNMFTHENGYLIERAPRKTG